MDTEEQNSRATESNAAGSTPGALLPGMQRRSSIYEQIKAAIFSGDLNPGQHLTEHGLADWLSVSRTPVREAVTRLEQDGLLVRRDRGVVVYERSPSEVLELYEARIVLEATTARFAAERRTSNDVMMMRGMLPGMVRAKGLLPEERASLNAAFHEMVWGAAHSSTMIDLLNRLTMHLGRYPATTLSYPGRWEQGNREHGELVDAIEERDADGAYRIAEQHFTEARDIRLKIWQSEAWSD